MPAPIARLLPTYEDVEQREQWMAKEAARRQQQDEGAQPQAQAQSSPMDGDAEADADAIGDDDMRRGYYFDPEIERARKVLRLVDGIDDGLGDDGGDAAAQPEAAAAAAAGKSAANASVAPLGSPQAPESDAMHLLHMRAPKSHSSSSSGAASMHAPPPRRKLPVALLQRVFSFLPLSSLLRCGHVDRFHYAAVQQAASLAGPGAVLRLRDQRGGAALVERVAQHAVLCHVQAVQLGRFAHEQPPSALAHPHTQSGAAVTTVVVAEERFVLRPPSPAPSPTPAQPTQLRLDREGRPIDPGVLGSIDPLVVDGAAGDGDGRGGRDADELAPERQEGALPLLADPVPAHQIDIGIDIMPATTASVSASTNAVGRDQVSPPQPHPQQNQPLLLSTSNGPLSPIPTGLPIAATEVVEQEQVGQPRSEHSRAHLIAAHDSAANALQLALDVRDDGEGEGGGEGVEGGRHEDDEELKEPSRSRRPSHRSEGSLSRRGSGVQAAAASLAQQLPPPPPAQWHFSADSLAPLAFLPHLRCLSLAFHPSDPTPLGIGSGPAGGSIDGDSELVRAFQTLAPSLRSLELRPAHPPEREHDAPARCALLDAPLPSPSGGSDAFRQQDEAEDCAAATAASADADRSRMVCGVLLQGVAQLEELERLEWTLPLSAHSLLHQSPQSASVSSASVSTSAAPPSPPFDLRRLAACAQLTLLHLTWPASPASTSALLDTQLKELQLNLPSLRIVQAAL